jgi:hypothetical protein
LEDLEASSGSEDLDYDDTDSDSDSSSEDDYFTRQSVLSDSESEADISVGSLDSRPSPGVDNSSSAVVAQWEPRALFLGAQNNAQGD